MKDIEKAVELLKEENLALAIVKDGRIILRSTDKGISPLYKALKEHEAELEGSSVADRVTGKAAAMICLHAGIKALKTNLISDNALDVLKESNIEYEYDERTPFIENRDRTGMCPVETMSLKTDDINELLNSISEFLEKIKRVN